MDGALCHLLLGPPFALHSPMLRKAMLIALGFYSFYFLGTALLLNTPLLRHLAGMADTSLTHLKFSGAWSLFPGHLRARRMIIAVRDQHVKVEIDVEDLHGRFAIAPLLKKQIVIHHVSTPRSSLYIYMKKPPETALHHATHSKPADHDRPSVERFAEMKHSTWTVLVTEVDATLNRIHVDERQLDGVAHISGGFSLAPGVEAEIFPCKVRIAQGTVKDRLSDLDVDATVRFHKFNIPETGGNEVFNYLDADVRISTVTHDLEILNTTLRSLPGYRFERGGGNLRGHVTIKDGRILPGSFVKLTPSHIEFNAPTFALQGEGQVLWRMPAHGRYSVMDLKFSQPKAQVDLGNGVIARGSVKLIRAHTDLYGVEMRSAFNGLLGSIIIEDGHLKARAAPRSTPSWSVRLATNGKISAIAGKTPRSMVTTSLPTLLNVDIIESRIQLKKPTLDIAPQGRIAIEMPPVDFRNGVVKFHGINANIHFMQEGNRRVDVALMTKEASRHFSPKSGGTGHWRGVTDVDLWGFDRLLDVLADPLNIPGIVRTFASSNHVQADLEWELSEKTTWLRARSVKTDGIWSLWGTYLANKGQPPVGAFEISVLGIPIGLSLRENNAPLQVFPSTRWYDSSLE